MVSIASTLRPIIDPTSTGAVFDQRRSRTAWFEGQHVTADQFNRDQSYHVTRQADLGRTIGRGVVEGLDVRLVAGSNSMLEISAGLGLAASGEAIHLPLPAMINLADIPEQRRIEGFLQGVGGATPPPETRTGLFVLAASTVEYASNPIGSYPASLTAQRSLEDSVINEAVLFTLTPFSIPATSTRQDDWRAAAVYRIFAQGADPELPAACLPLAMVSLQGNMVSWVDVPMVRRPCTPVQGDIYGVGMADRARRAAHFEQYERMLAAQIGLVTSGFPASSLCAVLPPMGRLPLGSVAVRATTGEPERLSQNWLPASVPCELVALPEDEIEALLRESLDLPPIDLSASDQVLANTPVTIIAPVPRAQWASTPGEIIEASLPLVAPPAVGGAPTAPADLLRALLGELPAQSASGTMLTAEWRALLARSPTLWFMRRRQFQRSDALVAGASLVVPIPEVTPPTDIPVDTADWQPLLAMMRDDLEGAFREYGVLDLAAGLPDGDPAVLAALLYRLKTLFLAGDATAALTLMIAVVRDGMAADDLQFNQAMIAEYRALEPAFLHHGLTLRITATSDADQQSVARLAAEITGVSPEVFAEMLRIFGRLDIFGGALEQADVLAMAMVVLHAAKADLEFATQPAAMDQFRKAQVKMAATHILPELAEALRKTTASVEKMAEFVVRLRELVLNIAGSKELRDRIRDLIREVL